MRYDMKAYDAEGRFVPIGSTVINNAGIPAELLKLTRWGMPGKSGKVFVRWPQNGTSGEYYDSVFGLTVKLTEADRDQSIKISTMINELKIMIRAFHSSVRTNSNHPTFVSRADLKRECQRITSVYGFILKLNGYQKLPGDDEIEKEVVRCEMIIEAMYTKQ